MYYKEMEKMGIPFMERQTMEKHKFHLPITARTKPSSTQGPCLFASGREILEQTAGTSSIVTLSICQLDRQWWGIFPAAPV